MGAAYEQPTNATTTTTAVQWPDRSTVFMDVDASEQFQIAELLDNRDSSEDLGEENMVLSSSDTDTEDMVLSPLSPTTPAAPGEVYSRIQEPEVHHDVDKISTPSVIESVATLPLVPLGSPDATDLTLGIASAKAGDSAHSPGAAAPLDATMSSALCQQDTHSHEEHGAEGQDMRGEDKNVAENPAEQAPSSFHSRTPAQPIGVDGGAEPVRDHEKEVGSIPPDVTSKERGHSIQNDTTPLLRNREDLMVDDTTKHDVLPPAPHAGPREAGDAHKVPQHPVSIPGEQASRNTDPSLCSGEQKAPDAQSSCPSAQNLDEVRSAQKPNLASEQRLPSPSGIVAPSSAQSSESASQAEAPSASTRPISKRLLCELVLAIAKRRAPLSDAQLKAVAVNTDYMLSDEKCRQITQLLNDAQKEMKEKNIDLAHFCASSTSGKVLRPSEEKPSGQVTEAPEVPAVQGEHSHGSGSDIKAINTPLSCSTPPSRPSITSPPTPAPTAPKAMRTNEMLSAIETFLSNKSALLAAALTGTSTDDPPEHPQSPGLLPVPVKSDGVDPKIDTSLCATPMGGINESVPNGRWQSQDKRPQDPEPLNGHGKPSSASENQAGISIPFDENTFSLSASNMDKQKVDANGKKGVLTPEEGTMNNDIVPRKRKLSPSPPPREYSGNNLDTRYPSASHADHRRRRSNSVLSASSSRRNGHSPERGRNSSGNAKKYSYNGPSKDPRGPPPRSDDYSRSPNRARYPSDRPLKGSYTRDSPPPRGKVYPSPDRSSQKGSRSPTRAMNYQGNYRSFRRSPSSTVGRRSPSPARSTHSYHRARSGSRNGRSPSPRRYIPRSNYDRSPLKQERSYESQRRRPSYEDSYESGRFHENGYGPDRSYKRSRPYDARSSATRSPSPTINRSIKPATRPHVTQSTSFSSNIAPAPPIERRGPPLPPPPYHQGNMGAPPEPSHSKPGYSPGSQRSRRISVSGRSPLSSRRQSIHDAPMEDVSQARPVSKAPFNAPEPVPTLSYPVPGLWSARVGQRHASIVRIELNIDEVTARYLHIPSRDHREAPEFGPKVQLSLLCLSTRAVQERQKGWGAEMTRQSMVDDLVSIPISRPRMGTLLVEVNKGEPWEKTWLPYQLTDTTSSLDISLNLRQGINTVTFIQLDNLADCTFILAASACEQTRNTISLAALDSFLEDVNRHITAEHPTAPKDTNGAHHESGDLRVLRSEVFVQ